MEKVHVRKAETEEKGAPTNFWGLRGRFPRAEQPGFTPEQTHDLMMDVVMSENKGPGIYGWILSAGGVHFQRSDGIEWRLSGVGRKTDNLTNSREMHKGRERPTERTFRVMSRALIQA
jgi:hypothetical protein